MSGGANAVAWLEAELWRIEELARAAPGHRWQESVGDRPGELWVINEDAHLLEANETTARHVVAHDPASVLRRVAADRQILAEHQPKDGHIEETWRRGSICGTCAEEDRGGDLWGDAYPCRTVLLLAEGYGWTKEA